MLLWQSPVLSGVASSAPLLVPDEEGGSVLEFLSFLVVLVALSESTTLPDEPAAVVVSVSPLPPAPCVVVVADEVDGATMTYMAVSP